MRISDWSSDVCSSDLLRGPGPLQPEPHFRSQLQLRLRPAPVPGQVCRYGDDSRNGPAGLAAGRSSQRWAHKLSQRLFPRPRRPIPRTISDRLVGLTRLFGIASENSISTTTSTPPDLLF